jgi:hypothetical protein
VLKGLQGDGLTTLTAAPQPATAEAMRGAHLVVTFGPEVLHLLPAHCRLKRWDDVPAVSDGYGPASLEIHRRVAMLVDDLTRDGGPPNA